jgi:hypothetical protein
MTLYRDPQRKLIHRINGQFLKRLDGLFTEEFPKKMAPIKWQWNLENWIINVILLHRSSGQTYTVRLETSATYHKGKLFDTDERVFDPSKVAVLDLPVPLDQSFSGYSVTTCDAVWINNLSVLADPHPLARHYRSFRHVGVTTPSERPTSEYVFPILLQVGIHNLSLGVLNMEYFAPPEKTSSPFEQNQLLIRNSVSKLLNAHSPWLLAAQQPEMGAVLDKDPDMARPFLDLHESVLASLDLHGAVN